ncbi:MAG: isoleucine--tRNA ligase [Flavobacteriaceae bacterium]
MNEKTSETGARDYSQTLYLPSTDFPMRAGLPQKEPEIIARWDAMHLYERLREAGKGRDRYILHDGPPYANGHLHIGHALNKILKDIVVRSKQMAGYESNYVPGWDCHGLPIEWKIEEQYRAEGRNKDEVPVNEFRAQCREFAAHWVKVQGEEFRRMGVEGDFAHPYRTMSFEGEATIAAELMKFAADGQLYRGSKPVMWSVVERTALAEAEVEYHDYQSDMVWVKFPISRFVGGQVHNIFSHGNDGSLLDDLLKSSVVIWTTTPWTIPGNRAISYSGKVSYWLYEVEEAKNTFGPQPGDRFVLAETLRSECAEKAKISLKDVRRVPNEVFEFLVCSHPLSGLSGGYDFDVPLLEGEHVTDETGTGFVHTAPGHGREDFDIWMDNARALEARGIATEIPFTVGPDGRFTKDAPGFEGRQVITDEGDKGDANEAVIKALIDAGMLFARGRLKHQYPHSWRSKKPVIFRNTPQWFVHMDRDIAAVGDTLRKRALDAIDATRFVPKAGQNRLRGMIEARPDWVLSRQRAWGVPIAIFVDRETGEILRDEKVNARIVDAFRGEGADAWFEEGAAARFLGNDHDPARWEQVMDILDVWFDSGSTHAFVLEKRDDLRCRRKIDGGRDTVIYLEGSDQHRGWFHSSLLESCGTRGRAPYDEVITHGFTMAEDGRKMSKSLNNQVFPQKVIEQYGADILRLWVASSDYADDQRIGPEILKSNAEAYRKLRNTIRWMLGTLAHYEGEDVSPAEMPELERYMLDRLSRLSVAVRAAYDEYEFKKVWQVLFNFATVDLSAFYFDIRKDALYCDPISSIRRKAALQVIDRIFRAFVTWLAPLLPFTMEEAWLDRFPGEAVSVHLELFPDLPAEWRDDAVAARWEKVRKVRRVVTGALEIERRDKRIGSSLEAAPVLYLSDEALLKAIEGLDMADISITSGFTVKPLAEAPAEAFRLPDVAAAVVPALAEGRKCARSWKILPEVGSDPDYPDISLRDAAAMRERAAAGLEG